MPLFSQVNFSGGRAVRRGNYVAITLTLLTTIGFLLSSHQVAQAFYDGPCPPVVDYTIPCTAEYGGVDMAPSGTACAQCDPFWANGQKHYHCAKYNQWNKRCIKWDDETMDFVGYFDGVIEYYDSDSGLGSASCVDGMCLAN